LHSLLLCAIICVIPPSVGGRGAMKFFTVADSVVSADSDKADRSSYFNYLLTLYLGYIVVIPLYSS